MRSWRHNKWSGERRKQEARKKEPIRSAIIEIPSATDSTDNRRPTLIPQGPFIKVRGDRRQKQDRSHSLPKPLAPWIISQSYRLYQISQIYHFAFIWCCTSPRNSLELEAFLFYSYLAQKYICEWFWIYLCLGCIDFNSKKSCLEMTCKKRSNL